MKATVAWAGDKAYRFQGQAYDLGTAFLSFLHSSTSSSLFPCPSFSGPSYLSRTSLGGTILDEAGLTINAQDLTELSLLDKVVKACALCNNAHAKIDPDTHAITPIGDPTGTFSSSSQ